MPRLRPLIILACALTAVAACSSSTTPGPAPDDAGSEASAPTLDAGADAASADGGACDTSPAPTIREATSVVLIEGAAPDGGDGSVATPPVPTGGDPTGTWIYTRYVLYLPAQARGQIDPDASKLEGRGFIAIDGDRFRQLTETTTTLETAAVGKLVRTNNTRTKGSFTADGGALTISPECFASSSEGSLGELGFSRVSPTEARLHILIKQQLGEAKLVIDMERAP
jgi:hypothetical protein